MMPYENMTLRELEREAYRADNRLAMRVISKVDAPYLPDWVIASMPKQLELFPAEEKT
jgi:hypothetical protein